MSGLYEYCEVDPSLIYVLRGKETRRSITSAAIYVRICTAAAAVDAHGRTAAAAAQHAQQKRQNRHRIAESRHHKNAALFIANCEYIPTYCCMIPGISYVIEKYRNTYVRSTRTFGAGIIPGTYVRT